VETPAGSSSSTGGDDPPDFAEGGIRFPDHGSLPSGVVPFRTETSRFELMKNRLVYLAGPDVFFPDAVALGETKKAICAEHGFEGVFPFDANLDIAGLTPEEQGHRLFGAMVTLMERCDLAIANLTPFRGPSMDVGTAVEIGYMHGRGKPVFGYTNVAADYAERVSPDGFLIEQFGLVDNLMVEGPIYKAGAQAVRVSVPGDQVYTSLDGFRACVVQAAEWFRAAAS
jgi:nucleoside 2-deoxyribosyltransferase